MTCSQLRKKPLKDFSVEDLRIMIGQNIGLLFLIPLAIESLENDILSEGDYYEGDLLLIVLNSDPDYWKKELENWKKICQLFEENKEGLETFDTSKSIKRDWFQSFESFSKINA